MKKKKREQKCGYCKTLALYIAKHPRLPLQYISPFLIRMEKWIFEGIENNRTILSLPFEHFSTVVNSFIVFIICIRSLLKMAGRSGLRGRRTRVCDCNYNMGEQYYKSALDNLDTKLIFTSIPSYSTLKLLSHTFDIFVATYKIEMSWKFYKAFEMMDIRISHKFLKIFDLWLPNLFSLIIHIYTLYQDQPADRVI